MPNPNFEPIIGSGFDDIARQRFAWAGFNRGVEESNLDRAAQAQRTRNAYLEKVAQMQQADADRQAQLQAQAADTARQQARQQYEDTESRRRFDIGTGLTLGQQALERQHWNFNQNLRNKEERKALDLAENFGKAKAPEAEELGQKLDDATASYEQAKADLNRSIAGIQGKYPRVAWDNRQKMFVSRPMAKTPATPEQLQSANTEFADAKADADRAATEYATVHESYNQLLREAQAYGLTVQKQGKKHVIFSPAHNKYFGGSETSPPGFLPRPGSGMGELRQRDEELMQQSPYAGFTQSTGTTPAPSEKVIRAHALAIAHPDWTKQQVIDAVNQEMP